MAYIDHPMQLSVFTYPKEIQTINMRSEDRVPCFVPSSITIDGQSYRGYISNISASGCLFILDPPVDKTLPNIGAGQEASIMTHLPGLPGTEILKATICSIRKEEREMNLGTQFVNMDMNFLTDVKEFIKNIQQFKSIAK